MSKGIAYKGDIYLRLWTAGVLSANIIGPIGGSKLTLKANSEIKERFGKGRDDHGLLKGSVAQSQPSEVGIGFNEVGNDLFAILFLGVASALNVTGGTVTGESITLVENQWVKTANNNISSSAITGKVLGTDFEENPRIGAVKALNAGAAGVQVLDYSYGGITANRIAAGVESQIDVEILFDGINLEDQSDAYVRIPKITVTPDSEIDLLGDDYVTAELSGKAIKLDSEPGDIIFDDNVAYA